MDSFYCTVDHPFQDAWWVCSCCWQVEVEVESLLEELCCNMAIRDREPDVHEVYFLCTGRELPLEFSKVVYGSLEILSVLVVIVGSWNPNSKDIIDVPDIEQEVVAEFGDKLKFMRGKIKRRIHWHRRSPHHGASLLVPEGVIELKKATLHDYKEGIVDCW